MMTQQYIDLTLLHLSFSLSLPHPPTPLHTHSTSSKYSLITQNMLPQALTTLTPTPPLQGQETLRYACCWLPFRFPAIGGGGPGIVGPIKRTGLKSKAAARFHPVLRGDRPYAVSILSLARDAASRLPGGLGSRADIVVLLRDSQFVLDQVGWGLGLRF